jgi:hypothetical protein
MLGDRLHSAARFNDDKAKYRAAIEHFKVAAKIPSTSSDALYNWANALFDLSMAARNGVPQVMTRAAEHFMQKAVVKYREAIALDPAFADAHNNLSNALPISPALAIRAKIMAYCGKRFVTMRRRSKNRDTSYRS